MFSHTDIYALRYAFERGQLYKILTKNIYLYEKKSNRFFIKAKTVAAKFN